MGPVKAVQFVIIIWQKIRLIKSTMPKLVYHHVASVYLEIAALLVGAAEIKVGALCPQGCTLPHPALYLISVIPI